MIDVLIAAFVILFGYLAGRGNVFLYILGMALYALDGILMLFAGDYFPAAFHGLALFFMFQGLRALFVFRGGAKSAPQMWELLEYRIK